MSTDPRFEEKLQDVVALYLNPPDNAVVFSFDEKSSVQALDRTQPGLPLKPGRCGTMTHDYKRHGTTSLFAAMDVASGEVIGETYRRHRHQELLQFLRKVVKEVPKGQEIHIILDNYSTHKHGKVREWPWLKILLRADSAYARDELMTWCKDNDVDYVIGLAKNSRLVERIGWELAAAAAEAERKGRPARRFAEFPYATLTSWSCQRRVIAKAEHLTDKSNPRFVVTSLPADTFSARTVYERLYCARGNMENTIKEQQLDLFSDRTSATCFAANQLRLLFSAFASILFSAIRQALHGTQLARATAGTLRLKLLKIAARVMVSVRRVKVERTTMCTYDRHPKYTELTKRYFIFLPLSMSSGLTPTATQAGSSLVWAPS